LPIRLKLEKDASNNVVYTSLTTGTTKNVIYLDANSPGSMTFSGKPGKVTGGTAATVYHYWNNGTCIRIRPNPSATTTWDYQLSGTAAANKHSFYQTFLHEVGHLVSLNHVNVTTDLMYYSTTAGSTIKTVTSPASTGAQTSVDASKIINWSTPFGKIGTYNTIATPIIASSTGNFTLCNGTSITLSVQNSSNITNWQWSNNSTNSTILVSTSGDYFVRVVRNGCYKTSNPVTVGVENIATPTIAAATGYPSAICNGNSTKLAVTNFPSNAFTSYSWSSSPAPSLISGNTATVTATGNYTVTVTQNGCSKASAAFNVVSSSLSAILTPTSPTNNGCNISNNDGKIITTVSNSHSPTTFLWEHLLWGVFPITYNDQNIYNLEEGQYYLTITNSKGCSASYTQTLFFESKKILPLVASATTDPTTCLSTASALGGTAPYTYAWKRSCSGGSFAPYSTSATVDVRCNTCTNAAYSLTVTDACGTQSLPITVPCCGSRGSGGDDENPKPQYEIYPNPTKGSFQILGIEERADIEIYDLLYTLVYSQRGVTESTIIEPGNIASGTYIVQITENNYSQHLRLIIER